MLHQFGSTPRRSKLPIACPAGYPYILFVQGESTFLLARSRKAAQYGLPQGEEVETVSMCYLFDIALGNHRAVSDFLKKFGKQWCQRDAMIFFKEDLIYGRVCSQLSSVVGIK